MIENRRQTGVYKFGQKRKPVGWIFWPFLRRYKDFLVFLVEEKGEHYFTNGWTVDCDTVQFWKEATLADSRNHNFEQVWCDIYGDDERGKRVFRD